MMEPHATIAAWEGDTLTLWTANQMIDWARQGMAAILGIDPAKVRVDSPYRRRLRRQAVHPCRRGAGRAGAKQVGRPVKIALQRPLMPNNTTHRHATLQRVRIGCGKDGRISAIAHENWSGNINGEERKTAPCRRPSSMRAPTAWWPITSPRSTCLKAMRCAPGEAPGHMALEVAMDEMAEKLGLDPVAFRILNEPEVVPGDPSRSSPTATWCAACAKARALQLEQAQPQAGAGQGRGLAGRHGRVRGLSRRTDDEVGRAGPA